VESWLAAALAHKACRDGYTVYYAAPRTVPRTGAGARRRKLRRLLRRLAQTDVLVIDDWPWPALRHRTPDFLEICDDRYQAVPSS